MKKAWMSIGVALALALLGATWAAAEDGAPGVPTDNDVNEIAKKLYCPVCPNTPLDVCETKACQDWREQIRQQLSDGWSEDEILAYFVAQYGERVLAEPRRSGFTSLVWFLPVLATLVGLAVLWQLFRSWRARAAPLPLPEPVVQEVNPQLIERVEKALEEIP
jgi:cytochrome c-type biogenesis protein CcmH